MAISFTDIMEIKNFLKEKHINVSEEWTEACISFVREDRGNTISIQNLKKSVYQQWLVADLEEIACSSLPRELSSVQRITLNESFALQVQGIRDISRPAYAQLKQLEGSVNENEEYSSAPQTAVPEWEAKPTRMLQLNLTDGCTVIQGMEYQPIRFLSPNLSPGIKVLIKGPVECRFGVLLLTSDNISILGGEVESKLQQYSRENILKEQLQIETAHSNQDTTNLVFTADNHGLSNSRNSNRNYHSVERQHGYNNNSQQISLSSATGNNPENDTEDILNGFENDDDFEQNIDYGVLDEIENSQTSVDANTDPPTVEENLDIWQEDEDMVREMMEYQDRNEGFKMPFVEEKEAGTSKSTKHHDSSNSNDVFTYLSTVTNNPSSNCIITIKGFIISVLSKLECTPSKGWSLTVKINDGTATVIANIHDKVLEGVIGVSAQSMMKKQVEAAKNMEIRKEVMQTISKCKQTLQNYNCLMDIKFTPDERPCIVNCYPVSKLHIQQLLVRVRCSS